MFADSGLTGWLTVEGSLTARLQQLGHFRVKRLAQRRGYSLLTKVGPSWQRAVVLHVDAHPLVFAHTEWSTAQRGPLSHALRYWGEKPLGWLIFGRLKVEHGALRYGLLRVGHPLVRQAARQLDLTPEEIGRGLWARQAEHRLGAESLIVLEIFSPALRQYGLPGI